MNEPITTELAAKRDALLSQLREYDSVVVALSGGVDSAVVAMAAFLAHGARSIAATGVSASLATGELDQAIAIARQIGIRHEIVETHELSDANYLANRSDRCYHCKNELYSRLESLGDHYPGRVIVNGANADDASDYRPGMTAARERMVRSPLLECGIGKAEVRALARHWGLPIWDKPASPCLSSRIAYGLAVSPERLQMIDRAEQFLRSLGFTTVRVRFHEGELARIEVPLEQIPALMSESDRGQVAERLSEIGFRYVTIDMNGFRSGSLNEALPVAQVALLKSSGG